MYYYLYNNPQVQYNKDGDIERGCIPTHSLCFNIFSPDIQSSWRYWAINEIVVSL